MKTGKRILCRALCALLFFAFAAPAEAEGMDYCALTEGCTLPAGHEGDCEAAPKVWAAGDVFSNSESGLAYRITDEDEKTAEVACPGEETARRRYEIPETVVNAESGEEYEVIGIGAGAFRDCAVKAVSAEELQYIGEYAFSGSALVSISIPDGTEEIGEAAFAQCAELEFISIPESVSHIGAYAFAEIAPEAVAVLCGEEPPEADESAFDETTLLLCQEGSRGAYEAGDCGLSAYFNTERQGYALELFNMAASVGSAVAVDRSGIILPEGAELKWASGDESVAKVRDGVVTAKSAGKATIYVSIVRDGYEIAADSLCFTANPASHVHSWSESWAADESGHWHACLGADCGETADFAEHDYGEWKLKSEPTESEKGLMERRCKFCGYRQTKELAEHTHSLTLVSAVPATCTEGGCRAYYSCECGRLFADSAGRTEITDIGELATEPLGHKDADRDGVCDTCFTRIGTSRRKH